MSPRAPAERGCEPRKPARAAGSPRAKEALPLRAYLRAVTPRRAPPRERVTAGDGPAANQRASSPGARANRGAPLRVEAGAMFSERREDGGPAEGGRRERASRRAGAARGWEPSPSPRRGAPLGPGGRSGGGHTWPRPDSAARPEGADPDRLPEARAPSAEEKHQEAFQPGYREPFSRGCFENVLKGQHMVVYINYRWPNKREDSSGNITWLGVKRRLSYIMGVECQI
ncbi:translation initiation factor IF-2-like isoform X2 [Canis lupus familiaris]|uniref:translation initiation factor IF-2-like isoform X2 n=1 Tax=Canis lupus familiaris TaxID=9615 RepID=UPI0018F72E0B|nr:translation initiation factor IF-2-like isoform X2 [Canis lupus familiaris]